MNRRNWMTAVLLAVAIVTPAVFAAGDSSRVAAAAQARAKAAVRTLIQAKADVNAPLADGATAVAWAAHWNDREIADMLIAAKADVNLANELGVTPLMLAAVNGSTAMVEKLIAAGANVKAARPSGDTALWHAARSGSVDTVKVLIAHGAEVDARMGRGLMPLMLAALEKHPQVVKVLVETGAAVKARTEEVRPQGRARGATPEARPQFTKLNSREAVNPASYPRDNAGETPRAQGGFTPLLYAALSGDIDTARILLEAGADMNEAAADGSTPLLVALTKRQEPFALFLLDKGANPNLADVGYAPLHIASVTGQVDAVKSLIAHKAAIDTPIARPQRLTETFEIGTKTSPGSGRASVIGATPFMLAARVTDAPIMKLLAEAGANAKAITKDGTTAVILAAGLVKRGNDDISYYQWTEPKAIESIRLALDLAVNINAANEWGETALHAATYHAANDVIKFLVEKGANLNAKNWQDQTPLLTAEGHLICCTTYVRHAETVDLLRKLGADSNAGTRLNFGLTGYGQQSEKADAHSRNSADVKDTLMWHTSAFIVLATLAGAVPASPAFAAGVQRPAGAATQAASPQRAALTRYCVTCHNERQKIAGLMLDQVNVDDVASNPQVWEKVARKLRSGAMPPAGLPRPDTGALAGWLEGELDKAAVVHPNAGRVAAVHRLNRAEYANAVRDLLGMEVDGRALLPADDSGYGFANIADVLSLSPGLLERYMLAAAKITRQAVGDPTLRPTTTTYKTSPLMLQDDRMSEDLPFGSRGGLAVRHHFPLDGEYVVQISNQRPLGESVSGKGEKLELRLDRSRVHVFSLDEATGGAENGGFLEYRLPVRAGVHTVGASFLGSVDQLVPVDGRASRPPITSFSFSQFAIDPIVYSISIAGPYDGQVPTDTAARRRIFTCTPATPQDDKSCARQILSSVARRAFRRPVAEADLKPLLAAYDLGQKRGGFDIGVKWGLEAVLVSPEFLFRIERDPSNAVAGMPYRLNDIDLASRLSFFIWSSIPDDELLDLAAKNRLSEPAILDRQVKRMLADPKSSAMVANFVGQWLYLRNLRTVAPNAGLFPDFDDNLREAFQRETELFVDDQIKSDRGIVELLTANSTFLNERLAKHYGVSDVYGSHFRKVTLPDDRRAGLLGQGSVLTVTSYANRTSPVVRGKWLLENLLGAPPPPPPLNVPALKENGEGGLPTSVRARLEQHRKNPVCASCHARMDPLGFALENFDAIGQWRTVDSESRTPIDASGTLPDGTKFNGPADFRRSLLTRKSDFVNNVIEKLLTYAIGRGLDYDDGPTVRKIGRDVSGTDYRWSTIVLGIVKSMPFQMRTMVSTSQNAETTNQSTSETRRLQ